MGVLDSFFILLVFFVVFCRDIFTTEGRGPPGREERYSCFYMEQTYNLQSMSVFKKLYGI